MIKKGYSELDSNILKCENRDHALLNFYENSSYRSFINKIIIYDDKENDYYYKPMEGSSHIFSKNIFNVATSKIFQNRTTYEDIMANTKLLKKTYESYIPEFYYEYDYAYPNMNYVKPFIQSDDYRKYRIDKMYYTDDSENSWFHLI